MMYSIILVRTNHVLQYDTKSFHLVPGLVVSVSERLRRVSLGFGGLSL